MPKNSNISLHSSVLCIVSVRLTTQHTLSFIDMDVSSKLSLIKYQVDPVTMAIFLRGCKRGGGTGRQIFHASLQYCQVQSRRGPSKTHNVVQKWIGNSILHVNISFIKDPFHQLFIAVTTQLKMSIPRRCGETRRLKSRAGVSLMVQASLYPTQSLETRPLTGTPLFIRHSLHSCSLNFEKLIFSLAKLILFPN